MQATAEWLDTDYYDILGVADDATNKQLKSAYRKLARNAHPDANPDDPDADVRFSDIAKAYEVLSAEETRAEYDKLRLQAQRPQIDPGFGQWSGTPQDGAGFVDLNELFADLLAEQQSRPRAGIDISASLSLDFVDAAFGLTTTLIVDGRSVNVRIPAGIADQRRIRLARKGSPGVNGGSAGDLIIQISVNPHPRFGRSGNNLTSTVPVRYEDAVLGGEQAVRTLDGSTVTVRVPPGSANGQKLRVKGKGIPVADGHGDMIVTISIDVPSEVTSEERGLLEQLRSLHEAN
jgi:molecular chaperone DnaJ